MPPGFTRWFSIGNPLGAGRQGGVQATHPGALASPAAGAQRPAGHTAAVPAFTPSYPCWHIVSSQVFPPPPHPPTPHTHTSTPTPTTTSTHPPTPLLSDYYQWVVSDQGVTRKFGTNESDYSTGGVRELGSATHTGATQHCPPACHVRAACPLATPAAC